MNLASKLVSPGTVRIPMIALQTNMTRIVESLTKQRIQIPGGFSYGEYNGAAQVKPWCMFHMVEAARAASFATADNGKSFLEAHRIYNNDLIFIKASSMQVKKEFYDLDLVKSPLTMDVELDYVGKTSFQTKHSAYLDSMQGPIFVSSVVSVLVCSETRLPKRPPDWWLEKYSRDLQTVAKPEMLDMSPKDDKISTTSDVTVKASDVDGYLHTNWTSYVKYCSDAFLEHCISKEKVKHAREMFREVKDLSVSYKKESSVGDSLAVNVAPHRSDSNTFYFTISNGLDVVCECRIEYHPL